MDPEDAHPLCSNRRVGQKVFRYKLAGLPQRQVTSPRNRIETYSIARPALVNLFLLLNKKGGPMKFCSSLAVMTVVLTISGASQAAQIILPPNQVQIAARLFTAPVLEPNGAIVVCFATNLDSTARDLEARIIDSSGADVTQSSS